MIIDDRRIHISFARRRTEATATSNEKRGTKLSGPQTTFDNTACTADNYIGERRYPECFIDYQLQCDPSTFYIVRKRLPATKNSVGHSYDSSFKGRRALNAKLE